jgi:hypothetical protein
VPSKGVRKSKRPEQPEEPVALTPEEVDRIIDQNVESPVVLPEEKPNLIDKVRAWFKRKG